MPACERRLQQQAKPSPKVVRGQGSGHLQAKKHCNCKNSRCLKLYCECFASGRYCDGWALPWLAAQPPHPCAEVCPWHAGLYAQMTQDHVCLCKCPSCCACST